MNTFIQPPAPFPSNGSPKCFIAGIHPYLSEACVRSLLLKLGGPLQYFQMSLPSPGPNIHSFNEKRLHRGYGFFVLANPAQAERLVQFRYFLISNRVAEIRYAEEELAEKPLADCSLLVSNLPPSFSAFDVHDVFSFFADVLDVRLLIDQLHCCRRCRSGKAILTLSNPRLAYQLHSIQRLNLGQREIHVKFASKANEMHSLLAKMKNAWTERIPWVCDTVEIETFYPSSAASSVPSTPSEIASSNASPLPPSDTFGLSDVSPFFPPSESSSPSFVDSPSHSPSPVSPFRHSESPAPFYCVPSFSASPIYIANPSPIYTVNPEPEVSAQEALPVGVVKFFERLIQSNERPELKDHYLAEYPEYSGPSLYDFDLTEEAPSVRNKSLDVKLSKEIPAPKNSAPTTLGIFSPTYGEELFGLNSPRSVVMKNPNGEEIVVPLSFFAKSAMSRPQRPWQPREILQQPRETMQQSQQSQQLMETTMDTTLNLEEVTLRCEELERLESPDEDSENETLESKD